VQACLPSLSICYLSALVFYYRVIAIVLTWKLSATNASLFRLLMMSQFGTERPYDPTV
jgi:hypothetical protein